tara:strand:- start:370 stop:624 length:255 start_codon:yes stop_codon:yes gene_type:complete
MKNMQNVKISNDLIGMAWSDKISFEEIKKRTGFSEKEVIKIMRQSLKKSSYILWRKRVRGKPAKHRKLTKFRLSNSKKYKQYDC